MSVFGTSRAVSAAGILLATITACGTTTDTAATPAPTPGTTIPVPVSTPGTTVSATTQPVTRCTTAALRTTLGQGEGAAGHFYVPVLFTNTGRTCTITGYPGVSYFAGDDNHQVGDAAVREPGPVRVVVLQPGRSAAAWVDQVNVDNYDAAQCGPTPVTGLRVYPPGNTAPVLLPEPGARACAKHMPTQRPLGVRAVQRDVDTP